MTRALWLAALALWCLAVRCQSETQYGTWTPVSTSYPTVQPSARCLHYGAAVDDTSDNSVILIGGLIAADTPTNEVWQGRFVGGAIQWMPRTPKPSGGSNPVPPMIPPPRYGLSATPLLNQSSPSSPDFLIYGGISSDGYYLDDIWQLQVRWNDIFSWTQIRAPSSAYSANDAFRYSINYEIDGRDFAPTPRALTSFGSLNLQLSAIRLAARQYRAIDTTLAVFLNNTSELPDNYNLTGILMFGGRSGAASVYSTNNHSSGLQTVSVSMESIFNRDFGDLWFYFPFNNTWVRIGDVTCAMQQYQCSDYQSIASKVVGLSSTLNEMLQNAIAQVRPSNLTLQLQLLTTEISRTVDLLQNFNLSLSPANITDSPGACGNVCVDGLEYPAPTINVDPTVACDNNPVSGQTGSSAGSTFCAVTTAGIQIAQLRPNSSEGHAVSVYQSTTGQWYWQFGGFSCAAKGVDIYSQSWDNPCFSRELSVLDASNFVWYTMTPPVSGMQLSLWPSPRLHASLAVDSSQSQLWLYGGVAITGNRWQALSDLHVFDINKLVWLAVDVSGGTQPSAVLGASLLWLPPSSDVPASIYLFGGCDASMRPIDQFYMLQTSSAITAVNFDAQGPGLRGSVAGMAAVFTLTARALLSNGSFGLPLLYALGLSNKFLATLAQDPSSGQTATTVPITEVGNGVYQANFSVTTAGLSGQFRLSVLFGHSPVKLPDSLWVLTPGPVRPDRAGVTATTNASSADAHSRTAFNVQCRDEFFNAVPITSELVKSFELWYLPGDIHTMQQPNSDTSMGAQLQLLRPRVLGVPTNNGSDSSTAGSAQSVGLSSTGLAMADRDALRRASMGGWYDLARGVQSPLIQAQPDGTVEISYLVPDHDEYTLWVLLHSQNITNSPFLVTVNQPLTLPLSIKFAYLALSLTLGLAVLALAVAVILKRSHRVVRAGSPLFLVLICLGALLCIISVPVFGSESSITCRLFPFLLSTGYILALSALFTKSYRVWLIFYSSTLKSPSMVSDTAMLVPVLVLLMLETCLNLVWLISAPLSIDSFSDSGSSNQVYYECGGVHSTAFIAVSVAFNGLVAFVGVYIAFCIRNVPEAFAEAKLIGAALYNLALCLLICIPLTWTATAQSHELYIIPAACILWCSFVTVGLTVAPKVYYSFFPPPPEFFDSFPEDGAMVKGVYGRRPTAQSPGQRARARRAPQDAHTTNETLTLEEGVHAVIREKKRRALVPTMPRDPAYIVEIELPAKDFSQAAKRHSHPLPSPSTHPLQASPSIASFASTAPSNLTISIQGESESSDCTNLRKSPSTTDSDRSNEEHELPAQLPQSPQLSLAPHPIDGDEDSGRPKRKRNKKLSESASTEEVSLFHSAHVARPQPLLPHTSSPIAARASSIALSLPSPLRALPSHGRADFDSL